MEEQTVNPLPMPEKRKYVIISDDEFLKIANESADYHEIVQRTGISYAGAKTKIKRIHASGKEVKASLLERQKRKK